MRFEHWAVKGSETDDQRLVWLLLLLRAYKGMSAIGRVGAVDRRPVLLSRSVTGALLDEKREAMAWNLRADFEAVLGAGILS